MAREITDENEHFSFFVEQTIMFLLVLFSISEPFVLPGFSSVFDPIIGCLVYIPLLTTFVQMFFLKFSEKQKIIFLWERIGFLMAIQYQQIRYRICLFIAASIFVVTFTIFLIDPDSSPVTSSMFIHQIDPDSSPDLSWETLKEVKDKLVRKLLGTTEIKKNNCHEKESKEAEEKLGCGGGKEESKTIRVDQKENEANLGQDQEEELKKIKGLCLNLEEEKKNLMLKLDIANESLEYYQGVVKDFTEQSLSWDEEKKVLSAKLEAASTPTTTTNIASASQNRQEPHQEPMKNSEENCLRQDGNQYYYVDHRLPYDHYHSYYINNRNLLEEKQELTMKLDTVRHTSKFYKAYLNDYEEICRNLRMEITEVSAKHFAEMMSAERYHKLSNELEDKHRRLEEEKNDLSAKLNAAKASSELYRSFLHDFGIVPLSTS